jgi:hypothetical protein
MTLTCPNCNRGFEADTTTGEVTWPHCGTSAQAATLGDTVGSTGTRPAAPGWQVMMASTCACRLAVQSAGEDTSTVSQEAHQA